MQGAELLANTIMLLSAMAAFCGSLASLIGAILTYRKARQTLRKINAVHQTVNSQIPPLCASLDRLSREVGEVEGRIRTVAEGPFWRPSRPNDPDAEGSLGPRLPDTGPE